MTNDRSRSIAIVLVAVVLLVTLFGANLAIGADRTILEAEYVKESLEDENAYAVLGEELTDQIAADVPEAGAEEPSGVTDEAPIDELLAEVITDEYLQTQTEENVDRLYAYLHGDSDDLVLAVDLQPLKEPLAAQIVAEMQIESQLAAIDPELAAMTESEAEFEAARETFEAEQHQRIQAETDEELDEEELEAIYDDAREEIRAELHAEVTQQVESEDAPEPVQEAMIELGTIRIDALVAEDASYDEFSTDVAEAEADLEAAMEAAVRAEIDAELPDTVDMSEAMDDETVEQFETLRTIVSVVGILAYALPIVAIGLAAGIVRLSRTRSTGMIAVGTTIGIAGVLGVAATTVLDRLLVSELDAAVTTGDVPPELAGVVSGIVSQMLTTFATQFWLQVGLFAIVAGSGVAIRRELLPIDDSRGPQTDDSNAGSDGLDDDVQPTDENSDT
ncbi:MAG: hypothetical protein ACQETB_12755 [Halobacteriota archaeon]